MIGPIWRCVSGENVPGFGGVYGSGVPVLIGGSTTSDFRNAPAPAAIGRATQACGKPTWCSSRGSHSTLYIIGMFSGDQVE
jgi:hypothetical protein